MKRSAIPLSSSDATVESDNDLTRKSTADSIGEHPELRDFTPLLQRLDQARQNLADSAVSWASLGRNRPERLGDFVLKHPIGRGGMGVVFEAWQESLGRVVALKILPRNFFADPTQRTRFATESRTIASLHHTNIVPIYGVGFDQGFHYFVMQRLPGVGVDQRIANAGPMPPRVVADLGRQAASALAHAHHSAVLHRDIKPSNLIVSEDNQLWVTDFGVAKSIESESLTKQGDAVGTWRYMAPEQAVGKADCRSDIYALGLTMYEMLTGHPALSDQHLAGLLSRDHQAVPIIPLSKACPGISKDLARIIETAMASDTSTRYATADQMAQDLESFLDGRSVSVRPLSLAKQIVRVARRHPLPVSLSAILLVALATLATTMTTNFIALRSSIDQHQLARLKAERTSRIAADALKDIFGRFALPSESGSKEYGPGEVRPAGVAISPAAADVLVQLIPYYDSLASELDSNDVDANETVAAAAFDSLRTIADIQSQVGRYDDALETIDRAIDRAGRVKVASRELAIDIAQLHNEAGIVERMRGNSEQADQRHRQAISLLSHFETPEDLDIQVDYEIARSHYLSALFLLPGMGPDQFPPAEAFQSRFAPPRDRGGPDAGRDGFGPPRIPIGDPSPRKPPPRKQREVRGRQQPPISRVKSLAEAIDRANLLLERLETQGTDTQPSIDQFATQRLLASALLERSRLGSRPDRNGDGEASESMRTDKQQSIQIFRRLVADHPSYDSLKYELATALADMDVFAADTKSPSRFASSDPSSTDADSEQAEDLREAMAIFDDLNARQPEVPRYALSNLHTRFKLARMLHVPHGVQDSPRGFPGHPGPPPRRNFARPENDRPPENRGDGPPGRSRMIESLNLYQSCVQLQNRLMDQNPDAEAYPVWQALFLEHVGEIQMQMHLDGEALQTYLKLDDIWRQIEEQQTYQPDLTNRQRQRASEQLDSLLERATRN